MVVCGFDLIVYLWFECCGCVDLVLVCALQVCVGVGIVVFV